MHSKNNNIHIKSHDRADEAIEELFESLLFRYQIGMETSMKGSNVIFDCVSIIYYKWHKINFNRVRSYTDSPDWIRNKKAIINSMDKIRIRKRRLENIWKNNAAIALNVLCVKKYIYVSSLIFKAQLKSWRWY